MSTHPRVDCGTCREAGITPPREDHRERFIAIAKAQGILQQEVYLVALGWAIGSNVVNPAPRDFAFHMARHETW